MKRIFISAGHGAGDPGAVGFGYTEASVVLDFRDLVAHYLTVEDVPFAMDGPKGQNLALRESIRLIRPGDVAVEFHLNASGAPTATGVETLGESKTRALGTNICEKVSARLGIRNRGAKDEASGQHARLAFVQAGGLIVELFFLSNREDLTAYNARKWLLARDIAGVLIQEAKK